jgi:cytochrome c oxidase assembly protein subunit 15
MNTASHRWFGGLTATSFLLCFCVVAFGAYVRLTDAGLGCPDWPGCYGRVIAPTAEHAVRTAEAAFGETVNVTKAWIEMLHRYIATLLGFLILCMAALAIRFRRDGLPVKTSLALLALVIFQGMLGMWTVTLLLKPAVVTAHLLGGMATLSLLLWLWLGLQSPPTERAPPRLRAFALVALVAVVVQIFLGGWTSTNYAALACTDLPTCHGQWWPAEDMDMGEAFVLWRGLGQNYEYGVLDHPARTAIHVVHRVGAVVVTLILLALIAYLLRAGRGLYRGMALLIGLALVIQISIGLTIVVKHLPLLLATAHNAGAALLLLTVVALNHFAWRVPPGPAPAT